MDLINMFMDIIVAPLATLAVPFLLSPYHHLQSFLSVVRTIFSEDVAGKVVLIVGASSGIGEHLAYEYARKGACLALVARRKGRLRDVTGIAEMMGSPAAIALPGDVSKVDDCRRFVDATVKYFVDHLVSVAGVSPVNLFEDVQDVTKLAPAMDINFWGSVNSSYFAIPYLKRSRGKIVVVASCASWLPAARMSFYCASKAALVALYETLRVELWPEIGITIASPGLTESEMTGGKFLNQEGQLEVNQELRDVQVSVMPVLSTEAAAKAIVKAACRGEKYLTVPNWYNSIFYWKLFCPDVIEWSNRVFLLTRWGASPTDTISKKLLDLLVAVRDALLPSFDEPEFPEVIASDYGSYLKHSDAQFG